MKTNDNASTIDGFRLNHIGLVVEDVETATRALCLMGQEKRTSPENDSIQKVNAAFIEIVPGQNVFIELLEPTAEDSPISGFLEKGGGLHHICFEVYDMEIACSRLIEKGFRCIMSPTVCRGFDRSFGLEGTRIGFFMTPMRLLIEIVELKHKLDINCKFNES